jgi:hypothetical protein
MGRQTEVSEHNHGDFFGELSILMATATPASVRAYVRYNSIKRVSSSVGEGSMAIAFVHHYLSLPLKAIPQ